MTSLPRLPDLANLEELVEKFRSSPAPPPKRQVVLIVHGTFAGADASAASRPSEVPWWKPHGSFAKSLDTALERHGATARCSASLEDVLTRGHGFQESVHWDGWSGGNSEVERRQGAYRLAEHIRALQQDRRVGTYHLVAHSHGGNVARRALRYLERPSHKLGSIICLGTPFLHFGDRAAWRRWMARIHWPMVLVFALVGWGLIALARKPEPDQVQLYAFAAIAVGALVEVWRYGRSSEVNSVDPPAVAVQFAGDEPIQLLRSCAALAYEPHLFLRDVFGGAATKRPWKRKASGWSEGWYERTAAAAAALWRALANLFIGLSNFWNGPVCRAAEAVTRFAYRLPILGNMGALVLILGFRPYRPPLRPFLASRMPRLSALFFHSFEKESERMLAGSDAGPPGGPGTYRGLPGSGLEESPSAWWKPLSDPLKDTPFHPDTVKALVAGAAALLYFALYPLDKLLGLPAWLGAVATRFAILAGARAAASGAPGMDMLGAAYQPRRTGTVPSEVEAVTIPEAIEKDIEERLADAGGIDVRGLRAALDPARRAMLMQAIDTAFTDVGLLHAQYYRDPRIIDYVAQRIAGLASPEWLEDAPPTPP